MMGSKVWGFALRATTPQAGFKGSEVQRIEVLVTGYWLLASGHWLRFRSLGSKLIAHRLASLEAIRLNGLQII
jgi:hypothetical protein